MCVDGDDVGLIMITMMMVIMIIGMTKTLILVMVIRNLEIGHDDNKDSSGN